jgi:uncharacterized protein YdaU (DUF1376 family)
MANPWYPFYPGDYRRDTAHLSLQQDGAYRRLLDHSYATGKPISTHVEQVFRICSAFVPEEQAAVRYVLDEFFTLRDDGWHNPRVDRELAKIHEISEKRSKAGRESARKRNPTHVEHMFPQPQPQSQPQLQLQPQESKARAPSRTHAFMRPTLQELTDYCRSRSNQVDPQAFLDHYTANGWKVGKVPMKNWQATIRKWERNGMNNGGKNGYINPAEKRQADTIKAANEARDRIVARG